jgi:acyl carrier protein phosphodiesterase
MSLIVELPRELEAALREAAAKEGLAPEALVVSILQERVQRDTVPHLPSEEAALLQQINEGLPSEKWQRYHELSAKRRALTLMPEEQAELIAQSDQIEAWNARRVSLLAELSRLRNTSLAAVMQELGLSAPPHA